MRTIDAGLLVEQKSLNGLPAWSVVIGSGSTVDVSAYLLTYDYREKAQDGALTTITLDNASGIFNDLTGAYAPIACSAVVELQRGLKIAGADTLTKLPHLWIQEIRYEHQEILSTCVLDCLDFWGRLEHWQVAVDKVWTATAVTTILEWILTQIGLTRMAGAMTSLTIDFDIRMGEDGATAMRRLMNMMPEYLYAGLDGEVKWKKLLTTEASCYTFGWNAQHKVIVAEAAETELEYNTVTVVGKEEHTGTATDAASAARGVRQLTLYDDGLTSDAMCLQSATAILQFYQAQNVSGNITTRPAHGLEIYDVVTLDDPPWGGADVTGRVIAYREQWSHKTGDWHQTISLGAAPEKPYEMLEVATSRPRKPTTRGPKGPKGDRGPRGYRGYKGARGPRGLPGTNIGYIPIGGIILWSGSSASIPTRFHLCDGTGGTPDLQDRFVVGAGPTYAAGTTGGAATVDASHTHADGTLAAAVGAHHHHNSTLAADDDTHAHNETGHCTDENTHKHALSSGTVQAGTGASAVQGTNTTGTDIHDHNVVGATDDRTHGHAISGEVGAIQGASAGDVTGNTASGGSAVQANLPPYYALCYIMRIT